MICSKQVLQLVFIYLLFYFKTVFLTIYLINLPQIKSSQVEQQKSIYIIAYTIIYI